MGVDLRDVYFLGKTGRSDVPYGTRLNQDFNYRCRFTGYITT
jgi:hypothetical protein